MLRVLLTLAFAVAVTVTGCGGGGDSNDDQSIATPDQPSATRPRLDCGSGDAVPSPEDLKAALLVSGDLPGNFRTGEPTAAFFEDMGDSFFERTVDESRFSGGFTNVFVSGEILEGGDGRIVSSSLVAFEDEEAAAMLVNHPYVGDPSVQGSVTTLEFGDEHTAIYYEVQNGVTFLGHVLQFRVGRIVATAADVVAGGDTSVDEIERLGEALCRRLRVVASVP